jgi:glycosyl transferase family 25
VLVVTPFAGFDRIRIINLPSRADRRREMEGELRRIGLGSDPRVQFVDGVQVSDKSPFRAPGEKGVFLAHLNILREAADAGASVLILEDDVDFTAAARDWQLRPDVDIAYGGYEASNPSDLHASNIIGAHCMGFSARAVQALAPYLEDLLEHESPPPIDGAYVWFRREHGENFSTDFAVPPVAVQRPSRSDIAPLRAFDRIPLLRAPISRARGLKRKALRRELTFGLPEAIIVSFIGIAIGTAATWYYVSH